MKTVPLDALHRELGGRMVPFAGYEMPVQYPEGIIAEHQHTRASAGLFDVSHMGQVRITGPDATAALEALLPVDLQGLAEHAQVYALLTNEAGGVRDDLIITRWGSDSFFLVINAACKEADLAYLRERLPDLELELLEDRALLALQGPQARQVLSEMLPAAGNLTFMQGSAAELEGRDIYVTCSGYTGEDGFELSLPGSARAPHRPGRAGFPAPGGGSVPVRSRAHRNHHAGGSWPDVVHQQGAPCRRRACRGLSRRRDDLRAGRGRCTAMATRVPDTLSMKSKGT